MYHIHANKFVGHKTNVGTSLSINIQNQVSKSEIRLLADRSFDNSFVYES